MITSLQFRYSFYSWCFYLFCLYLSLPQPVVYFLGEGAIYVAQAGFELTTHYKCMSPYPGPLRSTFLNLEVNNIYHIIDSSHCCIEYLYNLCLSLIFIKCEIAHMCTCALHVCHVNTPGVQKRDGSLVTGITGIESVPI